MPYINREAAQAYQQYHYQAKLIDKRLNRRRPFTGRLLQPIPVINQDPAINPDLVEIGI